MLTDELILNLLNEHMGEIKKFGVKKIGLFGSYSRMVQNEESDIDLLFEFEAGQKSFNNYMDLKIYLEDLFEKKIDLVMIDALKPDLKPQILRSVKYAEGA